MFQRGKEIINKLLKFPESHYTVLNTTVAKTIYFKAHNHEISEHYSIKRKLFCILQWIFFQRKSVTYKSQEQKNCGFDSNIRKSGKQKNSKEIYFQPRNSILKLPNNQTWVHRIWYRKEVKNSSSRMLMKRVQEYNYT